MEYRTTIDKNITSPKLDTVVGETGVVALIHSIPQPSFLCPQEAIFCLVIEEIMTKNINDLFVEAYQSTAAEAPEATDKVKIKINPKGSKGKPPIKMHGMFDEEARANTDTFRALYKKSTKSGVNVDTLGEVYNRGLTAWSESLGVSQQQYAFARVNSFINKGKNYFSEDADLTEARPVGNAMYDASEKAWNANKAEFDKNKKPKITVKKPDKIYNADTSLDETVDDHDPFDLGYRHGLQGKVPMSTSTDYKSGHELGVKHSKPPYNKKVAEETIAEEKHVVYSRKHGTVITKYGSAEAAQKKADTLNSRGDHYGVAPLAHWQSKIAPQRKNDMMKRAGYRAFDESVEAVNEISDAKKDEYIKKASTEHGMANFSKRMSDRPVEKAHFANIERKRKRGLGLAFKEGVNEESIDESENLMSKHLATVASEKGKVGYNNAGHKTNDVSSETKHGSITLSTGHLRGSTHVFHNGNSLGEISHHNSSRDGGHELYDFTTRKRSYHASPSEALHALTTRHNIKEEVANGEKITSDPKKPSSRFDGTNIRTKIFKKDTPGQCSESLNEAFNIEYAAGVGITLTAKDLGMTTQGGFAHHPSVIEEMEAMAESAKSADKKPVFVSGHRGPNGEPIPSKTVMRRSNKKIINSGNTHDGEPDKDQYLQQ